MVVFNSFTISTDEEKRKERKKKKKSNHPSASQSFSLNRTQALGSKSKAALSRSAGVFYP